MELDILSLELIAGYAAFCGFVIASLGVSRKWGWVMAFIDWLGKED